jgi:hypothetical protein
MSINSSEARCKDGAARRGNVQRLSVVARGIQQQSVHVKTFSAPSSLPEYPTFIPQATGQPFVSSIHTRAPAYVATAAYAIESLLRCERYYTLTDILQKSALQPPSHMARYLHPQGRVPPSRRPLTTTTTTTAVASACAVRCHPALPPR